MVDIAGYYDENAEASTIYDPVAPGDYRAMIVASEMQEISKTSDKGRCLVLTWKIEGGEFNDRLIWQRLNMWGQNMNNNDKVVSIANSQFAAIREATGVLTPKNTEELHDRPCIIKVAIKNQEGYAPSNEIKGVKSANASAPAARPAPAATNRLPPPQAANKAPAASGGSMPWAQR